jgi:hypothetical protein
VWLVARFKRGGSATIQNTDAQNEQQAHGNQNKRQKKGLNRSVEECTSAYCERSVLEINRRWFWLLVSRCLFVMCCCCRRWGSSQRHTVKVSNRLWFIFSPSCLDPVGVRLQFCCFVSRLDLCIVPRGVSVVVADLCPDSPPPTCLEPGGSS